MENNRFEDSFKNAFEGAEISPSGSVWTNIELTLEKSSGGKLKRNLLLFQLLAAASVVFACGIGALYYTDSQPAGTRGITEKLAISRDKLNKKESSGKSTEQRPVDVTDASRRQTAKHSADLTKSFDRKLAVVNSDPVVTEPVVEEQKTYDLQKRDLSSFVQVTVPVLVLPEPEKHVEPDAVMVMLARLKDEEKKYQQDEKKKPNETLWASLGFGAGSYKPNRQTVNSNASVTGESYSAGLNVAGKLSKRIVLQGGVSYLSQNADFISTTAAQGTAMLNEFRASTFAEDLGGGVDNLSPYTVNSALQFVSIPVQAGYIIVDRAFGIQLNGGIATDLFIRNTLSSENGDYAKVTQSAGKDSPYRSVNFSGLLGTEFSYRIADHYRISLNPGLRYSLNSIYKDEIAATITPVTFDISLRFRYIFK